MTLKNFLEVLSVSMPFTVGTIDGQAGLFTMMGNMKLKFLMIWQIDQLQIFTLEKDGNGKEPVVN